MVAARICPEDVVVRADDSSTPGMVCCVSEDNESRPGGSQPTAHVYWLRELDNDKMEPVSELTIVDRALLHGDTVIHNKRKGLVMSTRIKVDMRYADGTIVKGVDTRELMHVQPFRQGNWVVAEGWLGRVLSCRDDVTVQFDDGSQCIVSATANAELLAVQKMYERSPFFPSMVVKSNNADTFANAQWIRGVYSKQKQGTIASTRPAEVLVAWIAALQGSSAQLPSTTCSPDSLLLLNHFGHTWWRLGDRTVYARQGSNEEQKNDDMWNCCEIFRTETMVDIKFLDGSTAANIPATSTLMFNPGPHEFYPGDLVCDKDSCEQEEDKSSSSMSVVICADERTRMALVRKVSKAIPHPAHKRDTGATSAPASVPPPPTAPETGTSSTGGVPASAPTGGASERAWGAPASAPTEPPPTAPSADAAEGESKRTAECSAYVAPQHTSTDAAEGESKRCSVFDLEPHPDFSFRMGDVVLRLHPGVAADEVARQTQLKEALTGANAEISTLKDQLAHAKEELEATVTGHEQLPLGNEKAPPQCEKADAGNSAFEPCDESWDLNRGALRTPPATALPVKAATADSDAAENRGCGHASASTTRPPAHASGPPRAGEFPHTSDADAPEAVMRELARMHELAHDARSSEFAHSDAPRVGGSGGCVARKGLLSSEEKACSHTCSVGLGAVGEVIDVEKSGHVRVAWLGGLVSQVHPEEIYRVAIEEEVEDAMFYQEESAYGAGGDISATHYPNAGAVSSGMPVIGGASGIAIPMLTTVQTSVACVLLPAANALAAVCTSVSGVPVLGKIIDSSTFFVKLVMSQLMYLFVPGRLLPLQMQVQAAGSNGTYMGLGLALREHILKGLGLALSPSLLASHIGLGRLMGVFRGFAPATPLGSSSGGGGGSGANSVNSTAHSESAHVQHAAAILDARELSDACSKRPDAPEIEPEVLIIEDEKAWESHHYAVRTETPRSAGKFMSRVQKEWTLLRGSLPPDIYVVVYEDRCDLLQAVIKGPQDSPYADGLFFFDIQLPSEYPDIPPRVFYHSNGHRLNPNLYENGKVCLSLLGTWAGSSVESWDPAKSNILQVVASIEGADSSARALLQRDVVVSIQGLILVPEPYYNEPSYEQYRGTPEGQQSSSQYNESAMLLTLQSVLASTKNPPQYFAQLAQAHYRDVRERLLERCRVNLAEAKAQAETSEDGAASLGFALSLERLVPRLEAALNSL